MVTAKPYFAVSRPSDAVVFESRPGRGRILMSAPEGFALLSSAGSSPPGLRQAYTAWIIAAQESGRRQGPGRAHGVVPGEQEDPSEGQGAGAGHSP